MPPRSVDPRSTGMMITKALDLLEVLTREDWNGANHSTGPPRRAHQRRRGTGRGCDYTSENWKKMERPARCRTPC